MRCIIKAMKSNDVSGWWRVFTYSVEACPICFLCNPNYVLNVFTFMTPILVFRYTCTPHLCTCLNFCLVGSLMQRNCIQKVLDSDSGGFTNYFKLPNSLLSLPSPDKDNLSSWSVLSLGILLSYFRLYEVVKFSTCRMIQSGGST